MFCFWLSQFLVGTFQLPGSWKICILIAEALELWSFRLYESWVIYKNLNMCDQDFRLPVGSRRGNFPHETFFCLGTNVAGGKFPVYQGEKKSRVENSHDEIRLAIWNPGHAYSNSYIFLNFDTNENFTIQELPRSKGPTFGLPLWEYIFQGTANTCPMIKKSKWTYIGTGSEANLHWPK